MQDAMSENGAPQKTLDMALQMTEVIVFYIMNDVYEVCVFQNKTVLAFHKVDTSVKNTFKVKEWSLDYI